MCETNFVAGWLFDNRVEDVGLQNKNLNKGLSTVFLALSRCINMNKPLKASDKKWPSHQLRAGSKKAFNKE